MNSQFLRNLFVWFIIFASLMGAYQLLSERETKYSDIHYSEFLGAVQNGQILEVEIRGNEITGQYLVASADGKPQYFKTFGPVGDDL